MTNETNRETFALEARAEEIVYLSGDRRVRRGESDRLEVGSGPARDIVYGTERARIGGHLSEHTGGNLSTQASRIETTVEGKLTQRFKSDTTLLGGTMTETYTGGVFIGAGMSDDLIIGGGVRVTAPADLWLCGLIGMEEKLGSAYADGALVELYRLAFEREYRTGLHLAGAAVLSGTVHVTTATGFRQYFKVAIGVRDLTPGGDAKGGEAPAPTAAPAPAPAPPPGEEAASGGLLMAQGAAEMEDMEDLAALEDIRHLFGDFDTTVDSGQTGNRAALLEDLGSLAKYSETGEDVGDTGALANRLQEGAGLSDVVDAENLRAMLGLDESPETLDEARLVPDEVVDSQVLDDDANWVDTHWVERVCIDPVEPEVRYEHLLGPSNPSDPPDWRQFEQQVTGPGSPPDPPDWRQFEQHVAGPGSPPDPPDWRQFEQQVTAPGIPEDYNFEQGRIDFNRRYETEFRADATPGTSKLRAALDEVDTMIIRYAGNLPEEWIDDLGLSPYELGQYTHDPVTAYRTMTAMKESAHASGDFAKADFLRGVLDSINAQSYSAYQEAIENAEALRDAAFNSHLPETANRQALVDVLDAKFESVEAKIENLLHDGVDPSDLELLRVQKDLYEKMAHTIALGKDPVVYLDEYISMVEDTYGWSRAQVTELIETQAELLKTFSDPAFGFPLEVGGVRSTLGVDDFDMSSAVRDMSARIDDYRIDSTPGTTVLLDAVDRSNDRALEQLEDLPDEWLTNAGLTDDSGELSADVRREIREDPENAYRILTRMEADARARGLAEGAGSEDLAIADSLAVVIARLDHQAKSEFERAVEAAEALGIADNIPLANDVDQPAMVREIKERLAALDVRRATLDPNDAKALAQIEAEHVFLDIALVRVEAGYDPRPRLDEALLTEKDRLIRLGGDASELANIEAAYGNVADILVNYHHRFKLMPLKSLEDQRGVVAQAWWPLRDSDPTWPGYWWHVEDAESTVRFSDADDAVYFDTESAELRRSLDIRLQQLDREDTSVFDELYNRFNRKRPLEDTSGTGESSPPPPQRPHLDTSGSDQSDVLFLAMSRETPTAIRRVTTPADYRWRARRDLDTSGSDESSPLPPPRPP